ncbi:hypothetical protein [Roseibium algae]|uniref:Uncharacterized protein n=1 Tax=Roseibium algae TaxID=3123038 RepID=A0ABU8TI52_9HYPH
MINKADETDADAKGFELSNFLEEIRNDPWLFAALGIGTMLSLGVLIMHVCCFAA